MRRFWLLVSAAVLLLAGGCGGDGTQPEPATPAPDPAAVERAGLPPLAELDQLPPHGVATTTEHTGASRIADSGAGVSVHPSDPGWLTLDGSAAGTYTWAMWQLPVTTGEELTGVTVNFYGSGLNRYWLGHPDYDAGVWDFGDGDRVGVSTFTPEPGSNILSGDELYFVVLVLPGNTVTVSGLEVEDSGTSGGDDPIYDDFEINDNATYAIPEPEEGPYEFTAPGNYRAGLYQTTQELMDKPSDHYDYYLYNGTAGNTLTITLRFEVWDHFWEPGDPDYPVPDFNDLDVLFLHGQTGDPLNDFDEDNSGLRIYYMPFEHIVYELEVDEEIVIGIAPDPDPYFQTKSNAEYYLGIHESPAVYTVSGDVTIAGAVPDRDLVVFLEPGNFNDVTGVPGDPATGEPGVFDITGVPPGSYTLKVHSTARKNPAGYVWEGTGEQLAVEVTTGNVGGLSLDLSAPPT
jgi:hypothetical protein